MPLDRPSAIIYIDGLNLFYRKLSKHNELKWLNVLQLAKTLAPRYYVRQVKYFSAKVKRLDGKTDPQIRQQIYLSALRTLEPRVTLTLGRMRVDSRVYPNSPKSFNSDGVLTKTRVFKYEEKGTDVSIATEISLDMADSAAYHYILISSDSDFEPLAARLAERLDKKMEILDPRKISNATLKACQFPEKVNHQISKPIGWLN